MLPLIVQDTFDNDYSSAAKAGGFVANGASGLSVCSFVTVLNSKGPAPPLRLLRPETQTFSIHHYEQPSGEKAGQLFLSFMPHLTDLPTAGFEWADKMGIFFGYPGNDSGQGSTLYNAKDGPIWSPFSLQARLEDQRVPGGDATRGSAHFEHPFIAPTLSPAPSRTRLFRQGTPRPTPRARRSSAAQEVAQPAAVARLTEAEVKKMPTYHLKEALTERGLDASGLKPALTARLLEAVAAPGEGGGGGGSDEGGGEDGGGGDGNGTPVDCAQGKLCQTTTKELRNFPWPKSAADVSHVLWVKWPFSVCLVHALKGVSHHSLSLAVCALWTS
jgi:hypothetical protein